MKKNLPLFLIGVTILLTSCASPSAETPNTDTPKTPQALQPTAVSTALFQIVKADGSTFGVTVADLKGLPLAQVKADDGKMEEDPYLRDVLALAGVIEFKEVTLTGSSNPVTLTFEQVDENTILDFNNHGTMKLSSTYIPKPQWTKDVAEILVK
jgi:hypothetical protein